jgi:hypothetical protein
MPRFRFALLLIVPLAVQAQTISLPNSPPLIEIEVPKYKVAMSTPKGWRTVKPARNEVFVRSGKVGTVVATCMIRVTSIAELKTVTPEAHVAAMSQDQFVKMASISGVPPEVHVFDIGTLGGITARRIIHTQPHNGVPLTYVSHQALRGTDVVTATCYAARENFQEVLPTYGMLIGTTRFLP